MLYFVPTPIGNLGDFTQRSIDVLHKVDLILCEDTRVSGRLLKHYNIDGKLESFHAHNEHKKIDDVMARLQSGLDIAFISDAGTPGLSDPGFLLAQKCKEQGLHFTALPGANALLPALLLSASPMDRFYFEGFLPQKKGRQTRWKFLSQIPETIVLYESPYRIAKCLKEIHSYFDDSRPVSLVKEISKMHESTWHGTASELLDALDQINMKGEWVVVIGKASKG